MASPLPPTPRLMILDDDLLTREVLTLMAADDGFAVQSIESGDAALEHLIASTEVPDAMLIDMQMPGTWGAALAPLLRNACGPNTVLVAMSGSHRPESLTRHFDAFLLKPFSMAELRSTLEGVSLDRTAGPQSAETLSRSTYESLAESMPPAQLMALYLMCLDDADRRIATMRAASGMRDLDAYRRAAHSIKGGCGMVGALELASMAARMEENPLPDVGDVAPFEQFLAASARLRRILVAQQESNSLNG